jgi:hypothetical protein
VIHRRPLALGLAVLAPLALGGCLGVETTPEKSAAKAKLAGRRLAAAQRGVSIGKPNATVKVRSTAVIQDPNGVAAVVRVQNTGATAASLPVGVAVFSAKGKKLYANDLPGLDRSLTSLPVLAAGEQVYWVDNQILVAGRAADAQAAVGQARAKAPAGPPPRITLSNIVVGRDQDGVYAKGEVRNDSAIAQKRLTVACVAVDGAKVLAAGRAVVERLPPAAQAKKPTGFTVFFIGDPKRAKLECSAPPTVLSGGAAK